MRKEAFLKLSNGKRLKGRFIGAPLNCSGELVFTTAMVAYSEALTDPSYFGQILVFTYPLIGNYGIPSLKEEKFKLTSQAWESAAVHAAGVIVSSYSPETFHWTSYQDLDRWLFEQGVTGICEIDTRQLVHEIRENTQLFARIEVEEVTAERKLGGLLETKKDAFFDPNTKDIISYVSTKKREVFGSSKLRIGVLDCGVKWNILRQILNFDCSVELLPFDTDLASIDCHGFLLSNGPGNPNLCQNIVAQIKKLLKQERPVLGICLGHQLLSLAAGASIEKMTYGHRSHNQPVWVPGQKKAYISCQNHSYVVIKESLPEDWQVWFENINDHTVEGIKSTKAPFRSVQFHPESAGGPRDTAWILEDFVKEVRAYAKL